MTLELMKQWLEALETYWSKAEHRRTPDDERQAQEAITSLRQAIAEAEKQEPVAWWFQFPDKRIRPKFDTIQHGGDWQPLYTHPQPKREWVGLTDDERNVISRHHAYVENIIKATEAKLKEKNT